jgi:uncharacterized protein
VGRPGPRTRVRRKAERARYDQSTVHAILDEGLVCHVAFTDAGQAVVLPTGYVREADHLFLHGAAGSHMLRTANEVCVTVTLLDGLVLSRAAFHHAVNYRSVVIFGHAREVEDREEKRRALGLFVEHVVPGRSLEVRPPSDGELRATGVVRVDIDEASAKVRDGGPVEEPEDLARVLWAGHVPIHQSLGTPVGDDRGPLPAVPTYLTTYGRGSAWRS